MSEERKWKQLVKGLMGEVKQNIKKTNDVLW